jgi:uncharacterized protein YciI
MLCVVHRLDDPEKTHLRKVHRDAHLVHLEAYRDRILLAGPYRDPVTGADCGSMFLMRTDSLEEARRFAEDDPYMRHGVFRHLEVREWTKKTGSVSLPEAG